MLCNLVIEFNIQGLHDYWSSRTYLSYFLSILTAVSGRLTSYYLMSCFPGMYIGVNFLVIYFATLSLSKLRSIDRCYWIIDNTWIFWWIYWVAIRRLNLSQAPKSLFLWTLFADFLNDGLNAVNVCGQDEEESVQSLQQDYLDSTF
jgi:hypothetical protein